jgi:methylthioribose-1-phosphate isomerase
MNYQGKRWRTIWRNDDDVKGSVGVIDQRLLPHEFKTLTLRTMEECAEAIRNMTVRGAPLIGATAAYGICLALRDDPSDAGMTTAYAVLHKTRPTAINLKWALDQMQAAVAQLPPAKRLEAAYARAAELCDEDVAVCEAIGEFLRRSRRGRSSTSSRIATRAGWRVSIGARRSRRFSWRTIWAYPCMSGSTRRGRATRARR